MAPKGISWILPDTEGLLRMEGANLCLRRRVRSTEQVSKPVEYDSLLLCVDSHLDLVVAWETFGFERWAREDESGRDGIDAVPILHPPICLDDAVDEVGAINACSVIEITTPRS